MIKHTIVFKTSENLERYFRTYRSLNLIRDVPYKLIKYPLLMYLEIDHSGIISFEAIDD